MPPLLTLDPTAAFAINGTNLFEKLGLPTFVNLSTNFYTRVYDDEEEWFRSIFADSKKEEAIQNQYEFFVIDEPSWPSDKTRD
ncbi:two-on-two hemoglobin-3-like [Eucalyptus grandis]|uniref:two-on-two hemoglobin-3-like n=1 Tax=Eucalyptus grandis TaxID=71139 RepID=UPI00192EF9CD|nr:two-on-two hemoglobin-3-like [Eucalyptus grandis]